MVHRRYSKAVNLSNRCTTLYTVLYTVILRLFSSIRRFLTTPEQSFVEDPQRSILHREPISSNSLHDAKKKKKRERDPKVTRWCYCFDVSTTKTKLHGSICFVSQPIAFDGLGRIALYYVLWKPFNVIRK